MVKCRIRRCALYFELWDNALLKLILLNFFLLTTLSLDAEWNGSRQSVKELALFAFTGCYGHDVLMRQIGDEFDNFDSNLLSRYKPKPERSSRAHCLVYRNFNKTNAALLNSERNLSTLSTANLKLNLLMNAENERSVVVDQLWSVNWVQIFMYNFGFGQMKRPSHWHSIVMDRSAEKNSKFVEEGNSLLWYTILPIDYDSPWDLRGLKFLGKIVFRNHQLCAEFFQSKKFQQFLKFEKIDFVVVDHLLQECFTIAASFLNAPTVQFSNWPLCDGYITPFNVPSPPSYVPLTSTLFPGNGMNFIGRVRNSFAHTGFILGRMIQSYLAKSFYESVNYANMDLFSVEASHLFYAGRSELLFDVIRPISNRIKHFGCSYCKPPNAYFIRRPAAADLKYVCEKFFFKDFNLQSARSTLCPIQSLNAEHNNRTTYCNHQQTIPNITHLRMKFKIIDQQELFEMERRYCKIQADFPNFNLTILEEKRFILVSFGSVAKVEFMPNELLNIFLWTFGNSSYNIIWQTNSDVSSFLPQKERIPKNLYIYRWLPITVLLAHPNLYYAILHGGINTINEVLTFGVPILGVPLQGDQTSNLQRITELGLGELTIVKRIWTGELIKKMNQMDENREMYAKRARLIASMANMYRMELKASNGKSQQNFWLHWASKYGKRLKSSKIFRLVYRYGIEHFSVVELVIGFLLIIVLLFCFTLE